MVMGVPVAKTVVVVRSALPLRAGRVVVPENADMQPMNRTEEEPKLLMEEYVEP